MGRGRAGGNRANGLLPPGPGIVLVLAAGAGCTTAMALGCPGDEVGPKDGSEDFTARAVTCTCDCYSATVDFWDGDEKEDGGDGTDRIDVDSVCLPPGVSEAEYCTDTVCPLLEIYYNHILSGGEVLGSCDATCAPAPENGEGTETEGGASRPHDAPECEGRCADIQCEGAYVTDTDEGETGNQSAIVGNQDVCTYAFAACMDVPDDDQEGGLSSDLVCRGDQREQASAGRVSSARREGAATRSPPALGVVEVGVPRRGRDRGARLGCLSGRSDFVLLPARRVDRDGDGEVSSVLRAVQVAGTGRLTDDAWITSVRLSQAPAAPLWAARPNQALQVDHDDQLVDPGRVAVRLSPGDNDLALGTLGGGTSFVLGELESGTSLLPNLAMDWTCADSLPRSAGMRAPSSRREDPPAAHSVASRGYAFTLAEVGCPVDWPQLFTLRAGDLGRQPLVTLELFGSPSARRAARVRGAGTLPGHGFAFETGGLVVRGTVLAAHEDQALVDLDEVSFRGLPACTPGRYRLGAL